MNLVKLPNLFPQSSDQTTSVLKELIESQLEALKNMFLRAKEQDSPIMDEGSQIRSSIANSSDKLQLYKSLISTSSKFNQMINSILLVKLMDPQKLHEWAQYLGN